MSREAVIEVVAGPGTGKRLVLAPGAKAVLGRSASASLSIPDASISRKHVELEHRSDGVFVRDLGSRHGLALDGRAIPRDGALVVVAATLSLGSVRVRISRAGIEAPPKIPGIELREKLGQGGAGEVFAAWQDPPGRRVAVKAFPGSAGAIARGRASREHALEARLDHEGIVEVFDLVTAGGRLYLVRELVLGTSLDRELDSGALPWKRVAEIGADIAAALAHAHARGVVHRDVKPGNILLEARTVRAKLADFELARDARARTSLADATRLTKTGECLGTICYIAPEMILDARHASGPADVYGLAASLYHALAGERPFARAKKREYLMEVFGGGPPPLSELAPAVPEAISSIVARALSATLSSRPDAATLGAELGALAGRRARSRARGRRGA
ncbi:protein kinase [bacterium]|nr:protein kinase [bacterium]